MPDEFSIIKFLLTGVVPDGKLQKCTTGSALLIAIGTNGSDEQVIEGLARAGRKDLAFKYSEGCSHEGGPLGEKITKNLDDLKKTYLKEFRVILVCIADELTDGEDLQNLKGITTDIPKRALGNADTVLDFLSLLIKEKKLEPHTLDTALLDPLQHLRITHWVKKHSGKISDFKERLALRAAEEREGSRGFPVTENAPELAETQDSQSSEDGNESQDQPPEKEQKVAEVEHSPKSEEEKKIPEQSPENVTQKAETEDSKNCKEKRESQEQPPEKGQNGSDTEEERGSMRDPDKEKEQKVAEVEHSPKSEEEKKIPEQSPENVTQKAETEDSKNCKEKRESQEQPPEKGQNGSDTEEERGSRTDLDEAEDVVPEHSYADRARSDTAFDHINMMGFIDRKHKFSSWPNRSSMKVPDTTPEHYKVSRPVENVRLGEYKMTRTPRGYNHLEKDTVTVKTSPPPPPTTQPLEKQHPDEADFLICNSTPPGYVSYRDMNKGSWFISTFIETLERDGNR
ncbi:hypothetical protein KP79_PYT06845 [Mizuhopecten yessoensis]|uniref:Uncharacterized protein n=1 Tax=Mizuhopecten yessoensis TaxID=6573 RepID=A0A210QUS2_MIZYE|nr:hypothetical protein KP79_PYT06845 [Mizuhopecten yessoensis]